MHSAPSNGAPHSAVAGSLLAERATAPLRVLAVETLSWLPHLETGAEICLRASRAGHDVRLLYLETPTPDDALPLKTRIQGARTTRRVSRLLAQLLDAGLPCSHERLPPSPAGPLPLDLDGLRALRVDEASLGTGVASSLVSLSGDSRPDLVRERRRARQLLDASAAVLARTRAVLREARPDLVLVFNGRFATTRAVVEAARLEGVRIAFHERGADPSRFDLMDHPPHDLDALRTTIMRKWGTASADDRARAEEFFRRRREGDGIGWLSFIDRQEQGAVPPRKAARRIAYFSSSDDELESVGDLVRHPVFTDQRTAVQWLIELVGRCEDTELVLRIHPHLQHKAEAERAFWHGLGGSRVTLLPADHPCDSYALAESADTVVTYNTTMGAEAAYLGRPTVVLGPAIYRGLGAVHEPASAEQAETLLMRGDLPTFDKEPLLAFAHWSLTRGYEYRLYAPEGLFSGTLLGERHTPYPDWVRFLRSLRPDAPPRARR